MWPPKGKIGCGDMRSEMLRHTCFNGLEFLKDSRSATAGKVSFLLQRKIWCLLLRSVSVFLKLLQSILLILLEPLITNIWPEILLENLPNYPVGTNDIFQLSLRINFGYPQLDKNLLMATERPSDETWHSLR